MFAWQVVFFVLFSVYGNLFAASVPSSSNCVSPETCLSQADISQLSGNNITSYCLSGIPLEYQLQSCLSNCNFTATADIANDVAVMGVICSAAEANCNNVLGRYVSYSSCFDAYGGMNALTSQVISAFNLRQSTDTVCQNVAVARSCQRLSVYGSTSSGSTTTGCSFLQVLDMDNYNANPNLAMAQYICGSENVPVLTQSNNCGNSNNMISTIQQTAAISCSIAAATDPQTICSLMQQQANDIVSNSIGCTAVLQQFLLPRLNTYAIANALLGCSPTIQINGLFVQPVVISPSPIFQCNYANQINACFNLGLSGTLQPNDLEKLLVGNFMWSQFCPMTSSVDALVAACVSAFTRCRLPLASAFGPVATYDNSYDLSLGPFPLDYYGLNTVLGSSTSCPIVPPSLCPIPPTNGPPAAAVAAAMSTTIRTTPPMFRKSTPFVPSGSPRTTPQPTKPNQNNVG